MWQEKLLRAPDPLSQVGVHGASEIMWDHSLVPRPSRMCEKICVYVDGKVLVMVQPVTTSQAFTHLPIHAVLKNSKIYEGQCLWLTRYPIVYIYYSNNSQSYCSSYNKYVATTWPAAPCVRNMNISSYPLSLASHTLQRGREWSCCSWQVVVRLDNKMLITSAKYVVT